MDRMNRIKAMIKTTNSLVFRLFKDTPSMGVTPTIFHPVYPTLFTVTRRFFPSNSSSWLPSRYSDAFTLFSLAMPESSSWALGW